MNQWTIVLIAASAAGCMAWLVRDGVSSSLRAAGRTTAVLAIVWSLAATSASFSLSALPWRIRLMLALSVFAIAAAWWFHWRGNAEQTGPAFADRLNVLIAILFAALWLSDDSASRPGLGVLLLISGTVILAWNRR